MAHCEAAHADYDAYALIHDRHCALGTLTPVIKARMDELDQTDMAAEDALMRMPAPDLAALRWKAEFVFNSDDGYLESWPFDYLKQFIADFRALLA